MVRDHGPSAVDGLAEHEASRRQLAAIPSAERWIPAFAGLTEWGRTQLKPPFAPTRVSSTPRPPLFSALSAVINSPRDFADRGEA